MNIVVGKPPNFKEISKKFDLNPDVVFTYGENLYVPYWTPIADDLIAHEETHSRQQGSEPKKWWDTYIKNHAFRLSQEVEAYRVQYKAYQKNHRDRNQLVKFLHQIASDLSSPVYGEVIDFQEAVSLIKQ